MLDEAAATRARAQVEHLNDEEDQAGADLNLSPRSRGQSRETIGLVKAPEWWRSVRQEAGCTPGLARRSPTQSENCPFEDLGSPPFSAMLTSQIALVGLEAVVDANAKDLHRTLHMVVFDVPL